MFWLTLALSLIHFTGFSISIDKRFWLRLTAGETAGVIDGGTAVEKQVDFIDGAAVEETAGIKDGVAVDDAAGATEALTSSAGTMSGFPEAAGVTKLVQTWDQRSRAIN